MSPSCPVKWAAQCHSPTRNMKDFAAMNDVPDARVPDGHAPARACVEARMARAELLVEVSVIAAVKK